MNKEHEHRILTEQELAAEFGVESLDEIADGFYADYLQWDAEYQ